MKLIALTILILFSWQISAQDCYATAKKDGLSDELEVSADGSYFIGEKPYSGPVFMWHGSEALCAEGKASNSLKDGEWKFYFSGGPMSMKGIYENGKRKGEFVYYHFEGQVHGKLNYDNKGLAQGSYEFKHANGKLQERGTYVDDLLEGLVEEFYDNGSIKSKATYKAGKKEGTYTRYYSDGTPRFIENWTKDKKHGEFIENFDDGNPRIEESYDMGKRNGVRKEYHGANKLKNVSHYELNNREGESYRLNQNGDTTNYVIHKANIKTYERRFSSKGVLLSVSYFDEKGKVHGKKLEFDPNNPNKVKRSMVYANGELKGEEIKYYASGRMQYKKVNGIKNEQFTNYKYYDIGEEPYIKEEQQMMNSKKHGYFKTYNKDRTLKVETEFVNGKQEGIRKRYWPDGSIQKSTSYVNGKKDGLYEEFWKTGKPKIKSNYKAGKLDGDYEEFHGTSGETKVKTFYVAGKEEGEYTEWNSSGEVYRQGTYQNGLRQGVWKWGKIEKTFVDGVEQAN